jgi:two-component system, OmpR family, response regulator TctD
MSDRARVLLVHDYEYPLRDLEAVLRRLGFETGRARTCIGLKLALASSRPPVVVFTDTHLSDGSWTEIVAFAIQGRSPVPAIVVSSEFDLSAYVDALDSGAAEFIVPPFREAHISYVVQRAIMRGSGIISSFRSRRAQHAVMLSRYPVLQLFK